jgi:uncharacterized protein YndB with AHSA1/START domain
MTERLTVHASFTVKRRYDAKPSRVFQAFADPVLKPRWFHGPEGWETDERIFDFRVGGRETNSTGPKGGQRHAFDCLYHDIVPDERIIYSYGMMQGETRISVSLATIELKPDGGGTLLSITEHGAFLDGYDDAGSREAGTRGLLEQLARALEG